MKREILFRGKRVDNGEWAYGYYCPKPYSCFPCEDSIFPIEKINKCWESVRTIPLTLGQFTGLTDKNGVRIFEGDIIRYENPEGTETYFVAWDNESGRFGLAAYWFGETKILGDFVFFNKNKCTIIGNVHDDPELLKGEENV